MNMHVEFGRMPVGCINGAFAIYVVRGDQIIASRTGMRDPARCIELAQEYGRNYGCPVIASPRFLVPMAEV